MRIILECMIKYNVYVELCISYLKTCFLLEEYACTIYSVRNLFLVIRLIWICALLIMYVFLWNIGGSETEVIERVERRLSGPGSSPPTCRSKCGRCSPCKPVRVSIQPGFSFTLEYYPEAWRCKCGNNLFMP